MSKIFSEADQEEQIQKLLKNIELRSEIKTSLPMAKLFTEFKTIPRQQLNSVGFDMAISVGLSGDWQESLTMTDHLLCSNETDTLRVWKLRCLVESKHYPEAIALGKNSRWPKELRLHVNYLTALSFSALNMRQQADDLFSAISKIDPHYRDVSQRISGH